MTGMVDRIPVRRKSDGRILMLKPAAAAGALAGDDFTEPEKPKKKGSAK
jgi:hypothetical protein